MQTIKPIETRYGGYHFRSRLEARWAVFFDQLGLRYEYEAEGLDLPSGWYLPDFRLPDFDVLVEIKPQWPTDEDMARAKQFGREISASRTGFLMLLGDPLEHYKLALAERRSWWSPNLAQLTYVMQVLGNRMNKKVIPAARHAREARFEHGATP